MNKIECLIGGWSCAKTRMFHTPEDAYGMYPFFCRYCENEDVLADEAYCVYKGTELNCSTCKFKFQCWTGANKGE